MSERITVFGYGPTGQAVTERLLARGAQVRVAQRRRPDDLPVSVEFMACDALDADQVRRAMAGSSQCIITVGFEYVGKVWKAVWPRAMRNFIAAAEATAARVVFIDNLYMYGPQKGPLTETTPLTSYGLKPSARAEATRLWMKASAEGRILWAALRAPDFYGPGVDRSHLGETGFGRIVQGKPAMSIMSPDLPHAYAYVPDIARAVLSLLDAPNDAFGQAWHVPCAPTRTPRQILQIAADLTGQKLRITALPGFMLGLLALGSGFMRELWEMRFTWNRPYHVDSSKFAARFWGDATPFEVGVYETMAAYPAMPKPATTPSSAQTRLA